MTSRFVRDAPRWLFLGALIYAPWAYGCTTPATIIGLNWILGVTLTLWVVDRVLQVVGNKAGVSGARRTAISGYRAPRVLVITCAALLITGWWMVLNAHAIHDSTYSVFIPLKSWLQCGPGSVDQAISAAWMVRATTLVGVTLFVADLSQRLTWLTRLWWMVAIAGGSIALLGLLQKASKAPMIFWQMRQPHDTSTFFGTYYYHANAGALLNLALPIVIGLAVRTFSRPSTPVARAISLSAALLTTVAVFSNTSKAAQLLGIGVLFVAAIKTGPILWHQAKRAERTTLIASGIAIGMVLLALAWTSQLDRPVERWLAAPSQLFRDARWEASRIALGALPEVGCFGYGPGTFQLVFPHYLKASGLKDADNAGWHLLHEDYLQTLLEWGWLGAALWGVYFFGGIVVALRSLKKQQTFWRGAKIGTLAPASPSSGGGGGMRSPDTEWRPRQLLLLPLIVLALTGVALHSLVDFPLQIASIQLYVATYLGICWGSSLWNTAKS